MTATSRDCFSRIVCVCKTSCTKKQVSGPARAVRERSRSRRRLSRGEMGAEQLERVRSRDAESKREHRAKKKIEESLEEDAQRLIERKLRRAQSKIIALEHRIAYLEEILLADDALPVSPAVADDVAVDDDGDDDDDESVASTGGWDASEPQGVYDYVHKSERRFRAQVGVDLTDFDELLVDVLPFLKTTNFEGETVKKPKKKMHTNFRIAFSCFARCITGTSTLCTLRARAYFCRHVKCRRVHLEVTIGYQMTMVDRRNMVTMVSLSTRAT
jgi:hypothetical protein